MKNTQELARIKNSKLLRTREEIREFETTVERIVKKKDVCDIGILCQGFDDLTENDEVMFGLVHAIEFYDQIAGYDKAIEIMIEVTPKMLNGARGWATIMYKRILNHDESLHTFVKVLRETRDGIKETILELLKSIKEDNPDRFARGVDLVVKELEQIGG